MHICTGKKHGVSDPAFYDPIISHQKRHVRKHPDDPEAWLELGRLHEAKIDFINSLARRQFLLRYFVPVYVLLFSSVTYVLIPRIFTLPIPSWSSIILISMLALIVVLGPWMWSLRYPSSGKKYFNKAVELNPGCGAAYVYLGLIAIRRHQKRKACQLWEQAIRLGVNNKKIEQELKSLYEKEFEAFFRKKTAGEIRQQDIIDSQQGQITLLCSKVVSLERRNESLSAKVEQVKWKASRKVKQQDEEMADRISVIQHDYEGQIADLKQTKESENEAKELAERDFVRLTTEVMEAKAALEGQSLAEASKTVENIMGSELWENLSEQTRSYLATAEQIAAVLAGREENHDYSLVGMELCKALETEINRVLVEPFVGHLNGNHREFLRTNQIGESKGKPVYFTYLARVVDREHYPEVRSLTLGQYHFVLKRALEDEYALREYRDFLHEACSVSGGTIGKGFMRKLETLTKKYRNAIAHESPLNKKQYDHLRRLVFAGNKALLRTCSKIAVNKPW